MMRRGRRPEDRRCRQLPTRLISRKLRLVVVRVERRRWVERMMQLKGGTIWRAGRAASRRLRSRSRRRRGLVPAFRSACRTVGQNRAWGVEALHAQPSLEDALPELHRQDGACGGVEPCEPLRRGPVTQPFPPVAAADDVGCDRQPGRVVQHRFEGPPSVGSRRRLAQVGACIGKRHGAFTGGEGHLAVRQQSESSEARFRAPAAARSAAAVDGSLYVGRHVRCETSVNAALVQPDAGGRRASGRRPCRRAVGGYGDVVEYPRQVHRNGAAAGVKPDALHEPRAAERPVGCGVLRMIRIESRNAGVHGRETPTTPGNRNIVSHVHSNSCDKRSVLLSTSRYTTRLGVGHLSDLLRGPNCPSQAHAIKRRTAPKVNVFEVRFAQRTGIFATATVVHGAIRRPERPRASTRCAPSQRTQIQDQGARIRKACCQAVGLTGTSTSLSRLRLFDTRAHATSSAPSWLTKRSMTSGSRLSRRSHATSGRIPSRASEMTKAIAALAFGGGVPGPSQKLSEAPSD
jgi:hypothetical protein